MSKSLESLMGRVGLCSLVFALAIAGLRPPPAVAAPPAAAAQAAPPQAAAVPPPADASAPDEPVPAAADPAAVVFEQETPRPGVAPSRSAGSEAVPLAPPVAPEAADPAAAPEGAEALAVAPIEEAPIPLPEFLADPVALAPGDAIALQADVAPQLDAADALAYFDGVIGSALARSDIAGVTLSVVKDGRLLLSKGYGYADVARRTPVDPARTLFRPGSVSKLFTWTAVMQQVERGRIDLDADINRYLDFKIPPYRGRPVTMRQLMTHTAGFEESLKHLFAADARALRGNARYLKSVQPARVFAPGEVPAYSNYGAALAGYVIERVTRQRYEDYIEAEVLRPLGMYRSSFRQPLPKALAPDLAGAYRDGRHAPARAFELVNPAPAGGLSASADDMARFMLMQLGEGRLGEAVLLQPDTARRMHAPAYRALPALNAMALGYFRNDHNGVLTIGHDGATEAFQSSLLLFPQSQVGLFVSVDGPAASAAALRREVVRGFKQRYFPRAGKPEPTLASAATHGRQLVGRYESSRGSFDNVFALAGYLSQTRIALHDDGSLTVSSLRGADDRPRRWREVRPYVWREVDGDALLAAKLDRGRVIAVASDAHPPAVWLQPVPAWRSAGWSLPLLLGVLAVHALMALLWPSAALLRRHYGQRLALDRRARRLRLATRLGLLSNLAMAGLWLWLLARADADMALLDGGLDGWIRLAQCLALLSLPIAALAIANAIQVWRAPRDRWHRLGAGLIALACTLLVGFVFGLHLLTPTLNY
ncbi:serine hydrolase domain-containing protein [Lysobacter sp. cf310]|uniref:serine hydrolase domain-containing protein n=1 Tax=Lysobacter sp. cf310 TaxID=1761790 RepID=UPI0011145196|nr:serine hydrolase domain-containing protein [Lysobacter sp. cf310]